MPLDAVDAAMIKRLFDDDKNPTSLNLIFHYISDEGTITLEQALQTNTALTSLNMSYSQIVEQPLPVAEEQPSKNGAGWFPSTPLKPSKG